MTPILPVRAMISILACCLLETIRTPLEKATWAERSAARASPAERRVTASVCKDGNRPILNPGLSLDSHTSHQDRSIIRYLSGRDNTPICQVLGRPWGCHSSQFWTLGGSVIQTQTRESSANTSGVGTGEIQGMPSSQWVAFHPCSIERQCSSSG